MKLAIPYGAFELKRVYQRYLSSAIIIAAMMHILLFSPFMIYSNISEQKQEPKIVIEVDPSIEPIPPPSIAQDHAAQVSVEEPFETVSLSEGIPEAIPDEQAGEIKPFASQEYLRKSLVNPILDEGIGERESVVVRFKEKEYLPAPGEFVPTDELPVLIRKVEPVYPELARKAGVEGLVWIEALVDKHGKVRDAKCVKGPNSFNMEFFCEYAIQTAMQSEYKPGISNKEPVAVWVTYKVEFKLK